LFEVLQFEYCDARTSNEKDSSAGEMKDSIVVVDDEIMQQPHHDVPAVPPGESKVGIAERVIIKLRHASAGPTPPDVRPGAKV
jgi:hypothetical protein